jgi:hypothetical protein
MMRTSLIIAALALASALPAQMPGAAAKQAARNAVKATDAHIEAEQNVDATQPKAAAPAPTDAPAARGKSAAASQAAQTPSARTRLAVAARSDTTAPPTSIMRESYGYPRDGRRDPFVSLLTTSELRPTMSDLRLTGILYDLSGRQSVATLRDVATNAQYRVSSGSTLGRMRVSSIRPKVIVFSIDEFGMNRQDSLVIGDTTRARAR